MHVLVVKVDKVLWTKLENNKTGLDSDSAPGYYGSIWDIPLSFGVFFTLMLGLGLSFMRVLVLGQFKIQF